jgi:hypothetical protein
VRALRVTFWFFFTATSLLLGLGALFGLASEPPHRGPGAPLEGVASAMALVASVVCAIVFLYCLWAHPAREAFTLRNCIIALASYGVIIVSFVTLTHFGRYMLTIQIVDREGKPVPNVAVEYACYANGQGLGRLDRLASGHTSTNSSGVVTLRTNHAHTVSVEMRKDGFKTTGFHLEAAGHRYPHQITSPDVSVVIPGGLVRGHSGWLFRPHGKVSLRVTLH